MRNGMKTELELVGFTTPACPHCGETWDILVSGVGLRAWKRGALIQVAFPRLTAEERELMMTGFHPHCWDEVFGDDGG